MSQFNPAKQRSPRSKASSPIPTADFKDNVRLFLGLICAVACYWLLIVLFLPIAAAIVSVVVFVTVSFAHKRHKLKR